MHLASSRRSGPCTGTETGGNAKTLRRNLTHSSPASSTAQPRCRHPHGRLFSTRRCRAVLAVASPGITQNTTTTLQQEQQDSPFQCDLSYIHNTPIRAPLSLFPPTPVPAPVCLPQASSTPAAHQCSSRLPPKPTHCQPPLPCLAGTLPPGGPLAGWRPEPCTICCCCQVSPAPLPPAPTMSGA